MTSQISATAPYSHDNIFQRFTQSHTVHCQFDWKNRYTQAEMGDHIGWYIFPNSHIGILKSTDPYMNFELENPTEYKDNVKQSDLTGTLIVRCNNVLYVAEGSCVPELDEQDKFA